MDFYDERNHFEGDPPSHRDRELFQRIQQIVAARSCTYGFGVTSLAGALNISQTQLKRVVHRMAQTTPGNLIRGHQLYTARTLVEGHHFSVKEIAHQCGFNDQASFCRSFRSSFGCTPTAWRKRLPTPEEPVFNGRFPLDQESQMELAQLVRYHDWLHRSLRVLNARLHEEGFGVESMARELLISPVQLNRQFNRVIGIPPGRFIRYWRVEVAAGLLVTSSWSVAEVAYEVGFADTAHLCRTFRGLHGLTPGQFRERQQAIITYQTFRKWVDGLF